MTPPPPPPVFDIAIIGGGIAGVAMAREARLRGKSAVLFEKNTFGSGTSGKSSKLIHGGLRYLEVAWSSLLSLRVGEFIKNLRFVFMALRETHLLARTWPELIQEIELLMPIYRHHGRSRFAVFFGTWFYGFLSRCAGGKKDTTILSSAADVLRREPGINPLGLIGGVIVQDHTTDDLALVNQIVEDAKKRGACAFEHAYVTHYRVLSGSAQLFEITVKVSGETKIFYAKHLINAAGAWVDLVRKNAGGQNSEMIVPIAGAHVEMPRFSNYSTIMQAEDKRLFFVINRGDRARIGTTERLETNPDHVEATPEEIRYLLSAVKRLFPGAALAPSDIISTDAGIRPLAKPKQTLSANQISREHEFVVSHDGCIHVLGVKLTDHRRAAAELFDKLIASV